ncbi:MAG TPA: hypothetical protein VEH09_13670, partial [Thermodesulfobacteriota bacterium]|nr:hypothetical protein [Thermodesulfobacteriota bacterium]
EEERQSFVGQSAGGEGASPEGQWREIRLALFDIPDRKRLEETLKQFEKRLQDIRSPLEGV